MRAYSGGTISVTASGTMRISALVGSVPLALQEE
jgi:hypothetical protein